MGTYWLWKYCFMVICVAELSATRKYDDDDYENLDNNDIDLRGTLRSQFFVDTALANIRNKVAVVSPISAYVPLVNMALGTNAKGGNTLMELLKSIGIKMKEHIIHDITEMFSALSKISGIKLCIASKFYISHDLKLQPHYEKISKDLFKSTTGLVNFRKASETVHRVNAWVHKNTEGKIRNMVSASDISPSTELLIVNAVYLKGAWQKPFTENKCIFHTPHGPKKISTLKSSSYFNYTNSAELNAEIIKVPYKGAAAYLLIVLPKPATNLRKLLGDLKSKPSLLEKAMPLLKTKAIDLEMPRLTIETEIDLKQMYQEIGVKQVFKPNSGLDHIVIGKKLSVIDAKQKAFLQVDTKGTEGGEASETDISFFSGIKPKIVKINHPYLYFVMAAGQQLFSGIVNDPSMLHE